MERKTFEFLSFSIAVEIWDKPWDEDSENIFGCCCFDLRGDGYFTVRFLMIDSPLKLEALVHETWHLFMSIMKMADTHYHSFEELNQEIYAYNFQVLHSKILDIVLKSKSYKKLSEKIKEEKNGVI